MWGGCVVCGGVWKLAFMSFFLALYVEAGFAINSGERIS